MVGQSRINVLEILAETVEEPTERLRVEETQRRTQDGVQQDPVQAVAGAKRSHVKYEPECAQQSVLCLWRLLLA